MDAANVLLVEDNAGDVVLIRQILTECPIPVRLHIAVDGEQALQILTNPHFKPALIILDLNIPRITGSALLERWKAEDTPIVVFSSSLNEAEKNRVLALGASEFVTKPTDIQEFTRAVFGIIEKWIDGKEQHQLAAES